MFTICNHASVSRDRMRPENAAGGPLQCFDIALVSSCIHAIIIDDGGCININHALNGKSTLRYGNGLLPLFVTFTQAEFGETAIGKADQYAISLDEWCATAA